MFMSHVMATHSKRCAGGQAASMRQLHLRLTHENSRQEVFNRLHVAQRPGISQGNWHTEIDRSRSTADK